MKIFFFLLVISLFNINTFSQAPNIEWQKTLGGTGMDEAYSMQQTTDGGYIVAGSTSSTNGDVSGNHGSSDCWIVKLNSIGAIDWQKTLGGTYNEYAYAIQQTADGGYIVAGYTSSNNGDVSGNHGGTDDYWVVKLNSTGDIVWQKTLGGTGYRDYATSIQQTVDGGYIVAGYVESTNGDVSGNHGGSDFWLVKLNSSGDIVWQKALGGTGSDYAKSIQQTPDGGYIVAGDTTSNDGDVSGNHGSLDCWIVKLNSTGGIVWQKAFGGTGNDGTHNIYQTTDGGYIMAGYTNSTDGNVSGNHGSGLDCWVVKLNSSGNIVWQKALGGTGSDYAKSILQTTDGGYIVLGSAASIDGEVSKNHGDYDFWLVQLNSSGGIVWQKALGGTKYENASAIQQTTDGEYIVAGYSSSNDGDVSGNHGDNDVWVVKLTQQYLSNSEFKNTLNNLIYPNPSNNNIRIQNKEYLTENFKYKIIDLTGRIVKNGNLKFNENINIESLRSGNYIIQIQAENGQIINEKLIKN